jgi:fructosamine-3-kinase
VTGVDATVAEARLYPLLVHVNLFGGAYIGQVEAPLDRVC